MTKVTANFSDLVTTNRASAGTALRHVGYSSQLVPNGDLSNGTTGFTADNAILSVVNGRLRVANDGDEFGYAYVGVPTVVGKIYSWAIEGFLGTDRGVFRIADNQNGFGNQKASAIITESVESFAGEFVATATTTFYRIGTQTNNNGEYAEFDNISLREVIFDRATDPLVIFNHPENVPRIEYDTAGNLLGQLIEEAGTQKLAYTDITTSGWNVTDISTTTNLNGNYLGAFGGARIASKGETWNRADINISGGIVSGDFYSIKLFYASGTSGNARINLRDYSSNIQTVISGPVGNLAIVGDEDFGTVTNIVQTSNGNGIYCITLRLEAAITSSTITFGVGPSSSVVGADVIGIAAQFEPGKKTTSLIIANGNATVRAPDIAIIPKGTFPYNTKAITIHMTGDVNYSGNDDPSELEFTLWDNNSGNQIQIRLRTNGGRTGQVQFSQRSNGTTSQTTSAGGVYSPGTSVQFNVVGAFTPTKLTAAVEGVELSSSASSAALPDLSTADLKLFRVGCGHIKTFSIIPRAITPAQQIAITQGAS